MAVRRPAGLESGPAPCLAATVSARELPDALQAAVARRNGLRLVTRNTKDFPPERHDFVEVPYFVRPSA
ncbi:MAG: hypothetical protein OXC01_17690 [Immundisolibacterales bacterium]|nr:hypothetical protein [Immundisolibacterales bacterium]